MRLSAMWAIAAVVLSLALVSCASVGGTDQVAPPAPTSERPAATATKDTSRPTVGVATVGAATATSAPAPARPQEELASVGEALAMADSFTFTIQETHHTMFEGQPQTWSFEGTGAYAKPDRWRWHLEGQADVMYDFVAVGSEMRCADTRGPVKSGCSASWGGPLAGAAPTAVIASLGWAGSTVASDTVSVEGNEYRRLRFQTNRDELVTGLGSADASRVKSLDLEVLVNPVSGLPWRAVGEVKGLDRGGQDTSVDIVIEFKDYGQPVDINL